MSASSPNIASGAARKGAGADPRRLEKARAIVVSLSKYIGSKTIYADNSPVVEKFGNAFREALREFFRDEKELSLSVEQYQLKWRGEAVYDNREKKESIAFLLFKDGVGEITLQDAASPEELDRFVDLVRAEISSSSQDHDIVDRLWQADFTHISYRVFDEAADGKPGEGAGRDGGSGEQRLSVNDHPDLTKGGGSRTPDQPDRQLGQHLRRIVDRENPGATAREKELHLQRLLERLFLAGDEELDPWRSDFCGRAGGDKLLRLLGSLLDFTRPEATAEADDVLQIIERLVRYIASEAHIPTLFAVLEIQKRLEEEGERAEGFEALPQRIRHELTNAAFLLSLGRKAGRSRTDAPRILEYLGRLGDNAVPALREILAHSGDSAVHEQTCDLLFSIARDYIMPIIEDLDLENQLEAQDAVRLLSLRGAEDVPPIMETIVSSPDARIRRHAIGYLARRTGGDDAAALLCRLLGDDDAGVRIEAVAAVEDLRHPSIVAAVTAGCFEQDIAARSMEELERLFRAVGKLDGESVLPRVGQMASERCFLSINRARARRSKLLAVTALRHIPGPEALAMLNGLARDGHALVRRKALHALSTSDGRDGPSEPEFAAAAEGGEES
ncbi:MAG: HEAT repeat domain-containing protein [Candidatus Krumholzibacteria bacterium]|nr:HEAT repeat domain-containing protein [Candidatus Krumholzibacteria bacterium]